MKTKPEIILEKIVEKNKANKRKTENVLNHYLNYDNKHKRMKR